MPTVRSPRRGSMQYRPRKRVRRLYTRIRTHTLPADAKLAGFAGYKAGMTHVLAKDNRKKSMSKEPIMVPVTVVECPPLKVIALKAYRNGPRGLQPTTEILTRGSKELGRRLSVPKKDDAATKVAELEKQIDTLADIRLQVQTQPSLIGIGKKAPEVFELAIGGTDIKAKFAYARDVLGKDVALKDVFTEGQLVDIYGVTRGKGFQGPVKRFGVAIRQHKAEKTKRGPANVGPWTGNRSWTVPHAGQMGVHARKERNKWVVRLSETAEGINPKGGFLRYGLVRNSFVLLEGSVAGPAKRLVRIAQPARTDRTLNAGPTTITMISTASKQ